jgi:hypothetical protein
VHERLQGRVQPIGARDIVETDVAGQVGVARVSACVGAIEIDRARVGKGRVQAELRRAGEGEGEWKRGRGREKGCSELKRMKMRMSTQVSSDQECGGMQMVMEIKLWFDDRMSIGRKSAETVC